MICLDKRLLTRAYVREVSEWNRIHSAQVRAVTQGQEYMFNQELAAATDRVEQAKYALINHCQTHGC